MNIFFVNDFEVYTNTYIDAEVLQSGFGVIFLNKNLVWRNLRQISQRIFPANFSRKFFGLVSPGFRAAPRSSCPTIHAQKYRHSSPISHFRTQNDFALIFCLRETNKKDVKKPAGSSRNLFIAISVWCDSNAIFSDGNQK